MNMNSNIKRGTSINGMVLTDMPIEVLKAMRDSINDAIRKYQEQEKDKYATDIQAAIDAARDAGYDVFINDRAWEDYESIELYESDEDEDEDDDDWDNDDWRECDDDDEDLYEEIDEDEDEDDDPCYGCRDDCLHCPYC